MFGDGEHGAVDADDAYTYVCSKMQFDDPCAPSIVSLTRSFALA
jgi:hypothetical protein